jgi:hypothetical protein
VTRLGAPLVLLAAACSGDDAVDNDASFEGETPPPADSVSLRIDVIPSAMREDTDDTSFRALPQTFLPRDLSGTNLGVGTLELIPPQIQSGTVVGFLTNPQIANLPGSVEPVDATVWMRAPGTVQSVFGLTGPTGAFDLWVIPRAEYRLEVVPTNPLFPVWSTDLSIGAMTVDQDIDLGMGVPIYGKVSSLSGPLVGAHVYAVDAEGLTSSPAITDEFGIYQVRVTPGTWAVVCAGRELGLDPTLTFPTVEVGDVGANVDVTYPTTLDTVLADGRLVASSGAGVTGITVRFVAESLEGFETVGVENGRPAVVSWVSEAPVSTNGTIITRLLGGTYTIEVLPPAVDSGPDFSPLRLTGVAIEENPTQLPTLTVNPLVTVTGRVADESGGHIPDAVITCVEDAFDHRFWTTVAGADGRYVINLPEVQVTCDVAPPAGFALASTRVAFQPGEVREMDFTIPAGVSVTGMVTIDGEAEPFALVNIYDPSERLLGFGLTDDAGLFVVPVDLE